MKYIQSYRKRDKNTIYLILDFTRTNILDWYSEITDFVNNEMLNHLPKKPGERVSNENIHDIFKLMVNPLREDAANTSVRLLEDIEKRYNTHEFRNLVNEIDLKTLREIRYLIDGRKPNESTNVGLGLSTDHSAVEEQRLRKGFHRQARDDSDIMNFEKILAGDSTKPNAEQLMTWIKSLRVLQQRLSREIDSQIFALNYQQKAVDSLLKQIFKHKSA